MCLGVPAQIVELAAAGAHPDLATAEVAGVRRAVNIGLLHDEALVVGDWVLVHVGFAMSRIDEHEAARTLAALRDLGLAFADELRALADGAASPGGR